MTRLLQILCLVSLLAPGVPAFADETREADRVELRALLAEVEAALNAQAIDRVLPLLAEDVVVIFLNGEVARGPDQVRAYFDKTLGGSAAVLDDYQTKAQVGAPARFEGDLAMADGSTTDQFDFADGSEMTVNTLWSVVVRKQDGGWKVRQLHFSSHFFDNPLVAAMQQKLIVVAVAVLILGLVVGLLIGRRFGRKQ